MNLGENIFNAFEVVNKTHENVSRLIDFCRVMTVERKEFDLMSPKFLRYKSDTDYWGWNIRRMFLLFQDTQDKMLENEWRDGPIYVMEIVLYDPDAEECLGMNEPCVELAKFEYEDIKGFPPGVSPANYYYFSDPLYCSEYNETEKGIFAADMPEEIIQKCRGVKRVVCKILPLTDINNENAYEKIFGTFKELKDK